ncbi:hypothetical protein ACJX0J_011158, partial [Zea mays]
SFNHLSNVNVLSYSKTILKTKYFGQSTTLLGIWVVMDADCDRTRGVLGAYTA